MTTKTLYDITKGGYHSSYLVDVFSFIAMVNICTYTLEGGTMVPKFLNSYFKPKAYEIASGTAEVQKRRKDGDKETKVVLDKDGQPTKKTIPTTIDCLHFLTDGYLLMLAKV